MVDMSLQLRLGFEQLSRDLHEAERQRQIQRERDAERIRAIKVMRLPELLSGKATGGNLHLGIASNVGGVTGANYVVGPEPGWAWSVQNLTCDGLAAADTIYIYRNDNLTRTFWVLTGSSYATTFGKVQAVLFGGETLTLYGTGLTSTSQITLSGLVIETPQERLSELVA